MTDVNMKRKRNLSNLYSLKMIYIKKQLFKQKPVPTNNVLFNKYIIKSGQASIFLYNKKTL